MKKMIVACAMIMAAVATQAQTVVEDKVIDGETIRYVTEHLSSEELTALLNRHMGGLKERVLLSG